MRRSTRRTRRRSSRGEWVAFAVLVLLVGTGLQLLSRLDTTPVWLAVGGGFLAGVLVTISCRRWVARTAHRLGYVKVRGHR